MTLAFLLKYWHWGALATLFGFGVFEWHEHNAALIDKGRAEERARVADSTLAVIRAQRPKVDSIFVRDTLRLPKLVTSVRVTHDTVLNRLTDTLLVKAALAQDTVALHACVETVNHCADNLRLRDQEIAALRVKLTATPALVSERHWYSDRFAAGLCGGVTFQGKGFVGACGQLSLFRFP